MSERSPVRDWRLHVADMLRFARRVVDYTAGLDLATFEASPMVYDATIRNIELIGEAATRIPEHVREEYHDIPSRQLIATRNRLIHA